MGDEVLNLLVETSANDIQSITGDPVVDIFLMLQKEHADTWRNEAYSFWLKRIKEEIRELLEADDGSHEHPLGLEAFQLAAILINFLRVYFDTWQRDMYLSHGVGPGALTTQDFMKWHVNEV